MTNNNIAPLPIDDDKRAAFVRDEVHTDMSASDALKTLIAHTSDERHVTITLEWAMQFHASTDASLGRCIDAAMIAYFG